MKTMLMAAIAAGAMIVSIAPAEARQGCGVGGHRGPYGGCRVNRGRYYGPGPVVVGRYYAGRGWYNGGRYWRNRYRWHGGWRYR